MFLAAVERRELNGIELGSDVKVERGDEFSCLMGIIGVGHGIQGFVVSIKMMSTKTILKVVGSILGTYLSAVLIAWGVFFPATSLKGRCNFFWGVWLVLV